MNPVTGKVQNAQISRDIDLCLSVQEERAVHGVWKVMAKGYVVSFGSNENALKLIMVMPVQF